MRRRQKARSARQNPYNRNHRDDFLLVHATDVSLVSFSQDPQCVTFETVLMGTKRGKAMVADSLKTYGAGRSVLVDRDNRILAGNKTVEAAGTMPIQIVETDGSTLVVVKRTDLCCLP